MHAYKLDKMFSFDLSRHDKDQNLKLHISTLNVMLVFVTNRVGGNYL